MTVIAYRDGIMAVDSMAWTYDGHVKVPCEPKIIRLSTGALASFCGDGDIGQRFIAWLRGDGWRPAGLDDKSDFTGIVVTPDGGIAIYGARMLACVVRAPFYAMGASSDFVWGALHAGASASAAVSLAIQWTDGAAGDVQVEALEPPR